MGVPGRLLKGLSASDRRAVEAWWGGLSEEARRELADAGPEEELEDGEDEDRVPVSLRVPTGRGDRVEGGLVGLLVGDALGVPYEFHDPAGIPQADAIELSPPPGFDRAHRGVPPGTWSDDGAQALCLLASLLDRGALELDDFAGRMLRWWEHGHLAVDGHVFDIGVQTREALGEFAAGRPAETSGPAGEYDNGNGALMRVLPLALWHQGDDAALFRDAMRSSLPTHGHLRSQLCCGLYCLWARRLLEGEATEVAWSLAVTQGRAFAARVDGGVAELTVIDPLRSPSGRGSGYVVDCLHSARLALEAGTYERVVKAAVAIGDDTDTTAAVAGGIAGLREGALAIPDRWVHALRGRVLLDPLLDRLLERVG